MTGDNGRGRCGRKRKRRREEWLDEQNANENYLTFDLSIQVSRSSFNHGRAERLQQKEKLETWFT